MPVPSIPVRVTPGFRKSRLSAVAAGTAVVVATSVGMLTVLTGTAQAAATTVPLGTASSFAVLAGSGISNTGPTTIRGDIGTFPTTTITGGSSIVQTGTDHAGDAVTQGAKADLLTAYGTAAGEGPPTAVTTDLGGQTLTAGVYKSATSMGLTGALTLDAAGNPDAVFVFQAGSTLTTASGSTVVLLNGAQACHVFWQVSSSATLGTTTQFRGNILADTSITLTTGATLEGRALASNGAVTLDTNVITIPACTTPSTASPSTASPSATSPTGSAGPVAGNSPYGQVTRVPVGPVDTGDGSIAGTPDDQLVSRRPRLLARQVGVRVPSPR
jgi:Ice-binding-like